jgi:hypothetical protein
MLKKLTLVVLCGAFFFACFTSEMSFAGNHHDKNSRVKEFKEAEHKFIFELDNLLTKYEKAAGAKRDFIKRDIKKLVAGFLDKKIAAKKEKIARLQAMINEYEADKNKVIDAKVDFVTSDRGLEKIHKKKAHLDEEKAAKTTKK